MPCRGVSKLLERKDADLTMLGRSLLTKLKSGQGDVLDQSHSFGVWTFEQEGPTVVLKNFKCSSEKIVLIEDGFIYLCSLGVLVASRESETYKSMFQGMANLDEARLRYEKLETKPKPKVRDQT